MRAQTRLINLVLGAGVMYLLDPDRGNRRRALLRDKLARARRKLAGGVEAATRDARNRAIGTAAEVRSEAGARLKAESTDPDVLVERVRGVEEVVNELEVPAEAGNVPDLQGGRPRVPRPEPLQEHWAPGTRVLAGALGGLGAIRGFRRGGVLGAAVGLLGLGLLGRAVTNLPLRQLSGIGAGRRAVDVRKAIEVLAPIEVVWAFWSNFENFPSFMAHVRELRETGAGRWRWVVDGPLGAPVEWEAEITRWEPERLLAWRSVPGSSVENAGVVRFAPNDRGTRIDVQISYNPPAGALGHAVASFFGADPKRQMDEDLLRFKSLLETGRTTAHGEQAQAEDPGAPPSRVAGS